MAILKRPLKASTVNFSWTYPAGKLEPKLDPKYLQDISGSEDRVHSLYADGMSTRDIHDQLQDLYMIGMSADIVRKFTVHILPEIKEWQSRSLNPVYTFIFMGCIHYKVREDGRILSSAAYIILGVALNGYKDILSITADANETLNFRLRMHKTLKTMDYRMFCSYMWTGFPTSKRKYGWSSTGRASTAIHMLRSSQK